MGVDKLMNSWAAMAVWGHFVGVDWCALLVFVFLLHFQSSNQPFQIQAKLSSTSVSKVIGNLLYHVATRFKGSAERVSIFLDYICAGQITTEQQLSGEPRPPQMW